MPTTAKPRDVALKDPKEWKIAGKPLKRLDTGPKVTGDHVYGVDLKLPGMLCAAIKDCPVFGGKLISFDAAKVQNMAGVKHVLKVGDSAVAVVAERWWQAKTALDELPTSWDEARTPMFRAPPLRSSSKADLTPSRPSLGTSMET